MPQLSKIDQLFSKIATKHGYVNSAQLEECERDIDESGLPTEYPLLADMLSEKGYLNDAQRTAIIEIQNKVLRQREEHAWAQIAIGDTYIQMNSHPEAIDEYRVVLTEYDEQREAGAVAQVRIGDAYCLMEKFTDAIRSYNEILTVFPDQIALRGPEVQSRIAQAHVGMGEHSEAFEALKSLLLQYPGYRWHCAWAQVATGYVHKDLDNLDDATKAWKEVVDKYYNLEDKMPSLVASLLSSRISISDFNLETSRLGATSREEISFYLATKHELDKELDEARKHYRKYILSNNIGWSYSFALRAMKRLKQ